MLYRNRAGFTLVELLVVVGIIAALISILLPVVQKARLAAVETACCSRLRTLGQSVLMYGNDNHGFFPPVTESLNTPPAIFPVAGMGINPAKPAYLLRYVATNAPDTCNTGPTTMFVCPLWQSRSPTDVTNNSAGNGQYTYQYNAILGGIYPPTKGNVTAYAAGVPFRPFPITKVHYASQVALFIDGNAPNNCANSIATIAALTGVITPGIGFDRDTLNTWETSRSCLVTHRVTTGRAVSGRPIYRGVNNVAFVDGSVRSIRIGTSAQYARDRLSWDDTIFDPRNWTTARYLNAFLNP